ncbi:MAG: glycosyltransferase family 2 protein, partial [Anaerolineae bacterium]
MTDPLLTVIVVSWNTRELLRNCLASLARSVDLAAETIVVDNGSADGTLEMLAADFPAVRVIANAMNRGFAAANNQGLAAAHGRYFLLLNSDTVVAPDVLSRLCAFMETHPEAGASGPQLHNIDGTLQPSGRAFPTLFQAVTALLPMPRALRKTLASPVERRDYTQVAMVDELSGAALCLWRTAIEQVGGLDEDFFFLGEDVDLCWRLHAAGWKIYYVPQAVVTHLWGGSRVRLSE